MQSAKMDFVLDYPNDMWHAAQTCWGSCKLCSPEQLAFTLQSTLMAQAQRAASPSTMTQPIRMTKSGAFSRYAAAFCFTAWCLP